MKTHLRTILLTTGIASLLCAAPAGADTLPEPSKAAPAASTSARAMEKTSLTITDRQGHDHRFTVEIARTPKDRAAGLTHRETVPEGTGMLFLFNPPEAAEMWMRDTPVSLDMLFIGPDGRIQAIAEKTVPYSEARTGGQGRSSAVLELAGGSTEKAGIVVGDKVTSDALAPARHVQ